MTDTIASLKRELKVLGPVDYSAGSRQMRETILNQIAELENPADVDAEAVRKAESADSRAVEGAAHAAVFAAKNISCGCAHCRTYAEAI